MPSLLPILSYDVPIQGGEIPHESSSIIIHSSSASNTGGGGGGCGGCGGSGSGSVLKKHTTVCQDLPEKKKKHHQCGKKSDAGHGHTVAESVVADAGVGGDKAAAAAAAVAVAEALKVMKKAVYAVQMAMYNGLKSDVQLKAAMGLLTQAEYGDVVTERSNGKQCGYPLCPNSLKVDKARKGRYHISLREHKVYDLEETRAFCSTGCLVTSKTFAAGLPSNHEGLIEHQKLEEIIACVRGLSLSAATPAATPATAAAAGKMTASAQDSDGKVVVRERNDGDREPGEFEFPAGSSAVEGYVPRTKLELKTQDLKPLKSALKQSPRKNQRISWADEIPAAVAQPDVDESFTFATIVESESVPQVDGERLGAAQVVADALAQAANVASAGEVEASKAAATAGLAIVPPTEIAADSFEFAVSPAAAEESEEDLISRSSWYSSPPKGFKAEVSIFGHLWMALDEWVSSGTLAHIYGKTDQEFQNVNGRVPVDGDDGSSSSDILRTISSCVSRALPDVVQALAVSEPLSVIERAVGRLLGTMHFSKALPAFTTKHWRMIAALFLDALSVYRLPGLSGQLTNNRALLRKLIIDCGMNDPEYESFKELLLPLGRLPAFASSGGG